MPTRFTVSLAAVLVCASLAGDARTEKTQDRVFTSPSGITLRLLLDDSNVGPEISMGEMTFPPNLDSGDHTHGAIEIFYVLSGELEHVVNGQSQILKPGMSGFVKLGDRVRHKTGPGGPVKTLVIWVPGAEANKIASRWKREP